MVCNSGDMNTLCNSFEMLSLPIMESLFDFTDTANHSPNKYLCILFLILRAAEMFFLYGMKNLPLQMVLKITLRLTDP